MRGGREDRNRDQLAEQDLNPREHRTRIDIAATSIHSDTPADDRRSCMPSGIVYAVQHQRQSTGVLIVTDHLLAFGMYDSVVICSVTGRD